jgi:hypothetical protein
MAHARRSTMAAKSDLEPIGDLAEQLPGNRRRRPD